MTQSISSNTLKKNERLSSTKLIDKLFSKGKSFVVYPFRIVWLSIPEDIEESPKVSILTSVSKKKFKTAVKRNKVKRLMRESYRLNKHPLHSHLNDKNKKIAVAFIYLDTEIKEYSFFEKKIKEALDVLIKRIE
jgi:ribonuclease P protein component